MASVCVNTVVLALLSLLVSADNSDEASKEVVVKNSPVFNSISKIYTQLHYPGTRQQYNQYYPHARIPDRSFTRFSEVTKSGFARKQLLSSYEDKIVRRLGSRGPFEIRGPRQRYQRPNYSNDRPAGQYGRNEHPRYGPQNGLSWNGGNREPGYGRRGEEGESYTERGYGSRGQDEEGNEEEGDEEEEGAEENNGQEQEREEKEGGRKMTGQNSGRRTPQSSRREGDDGAGRSHQGSSSTSNFRRRPQGSYGGRSYAQERASQYPQYPSNRDTRNSVSERHPGNQRQQYAGNQFQQNPGHQFPQNHGNQFQPNPANQNQLNPWNQFQQTSTRQVQPYQRSQNQMRTNRPDQGNL